MNPKKFLLRVPCLCLLLLLIPVFAYAIPVTFTSLDEKSIATGTSSTTASSFGPASFEITNGTDSIWTDFHFSLSWTPPPGVPYLGGSGALYFSDYTGPGTDTISGGAGNQYRNYLLDVVDLLIAPGSDFIFTISGGKLGEGLAGTYNYYVYGMPTTDGSGPPPVPEPSTFLLLFAGLAGLACYRRKCNKT